MPVNVCGLCKAFDGKPVLDGFSMVLADGEAVCVMGPSGCGKTTLLSILMGLVPQDAGMVEGIDGKRMAAVFQENRLCENLGAVANARLACGHAVPRAVIVAHLVRLGLSDCAGKPARELSGGMKRRVAIARALLMDFDVLFLDEPFKGLDEDTKKMTMAFVREKSHGRTVIMVSHDPLEAEALGARIVRMA